MANHYTRQIPDLSEAQRQQLQRWVRRSTTAQALVLRARIVLETAVGKSDLEVAGELGTTRGTVGKWRRRFLRAGCDGLVDEPRPGAPRTIGDDDVERVVVQTLETIPTGATHWSYALDGQGVWAERGDGKPHLACVRSEAASLRDLQAVARSAVHREGTRHRGSVPARARGGVVLDEKPQIQALERRRCVQGAERRTHDYRRHGTTSLFAALDVATGEVLGRCFPRHRAVEFRRFLATSPKPSRRTSIHPGQLRHSQDGDDSRLAGWSASTALHAHERILDQPGRTVVRGDYRTADPARHAPQHRNRR